MASNFIKIVWVVFFTLLFENSVNAQLFNFQSTVIPVGGQTCIPVNVIGVMGNGLDNPVFPTGIPPINFIAQLTLDIQTTHPCTLEITLISPGGTVLTLSSFNGAGGVNYTN